MSGRLRGRVAIVTGAGGGVGRSHALRLAAEGARVVVNDLGCSLAGEGTDGSAAEDVAAEIRAAGGEAVASRHDIAEWSGAKEMVAQAVETFGDLHILVNNAGIVRDRTLANLQEDEWDAVIRVHLKGHAAPLHHAMAFWKKPPRSGEPAKRSVIHTASLAGYRGNFGQAAYSTAKLGVVALSRVAAIEGERFGVRSNVISPAARSRLGSAMPGFDEMVKKPEGDAFDYFSPDNVSPLVAWLAGPDCPATGQIYHLGGNDLFVFSMPPIVHHLKTERQWTLEALDEQLSGRMVETVVEQFFPMDAA